MMRRLLALIATGMALAASAGDCKRTASVCIDAAPYKVISGVTVTLADVGGCWMYEDTYTCLKPNAIDYCQPLITAGCWQTSATCVQHDTLFGTGCMTQRNTYRCNDPGMPTPPNTIRLDNTYTLVSSSYNKAACSAYTSNPTCQLAESVCLQTTPDSPLPPGISPSDVAPDGCYKREDRYVCLGGIDDACAEYASNPNCSLVSSQCDEDAMVGGQCMSMTKSYKCLDKPASTKTVTDCGSQKFCFNGECFDTGFTPDNDFAYVVTMMEAMREAGMYIDEGDLRLFKGVASTCQRKPFVNCCKAKAGGGDTSNFSVVHGIYQGAGAAYDYLRSKFNYDALFMSDKPNWFYRTLYGGGDPMFITPTFSYYGFSIGFATGAGGMATLPTGSICIVCDHSAGFAIGFDPMTFALSLAFNFVLSELMSCEQSDAMTAMRRGQNLCHYVGNYKKGLLKTTRVDVHCCYNSRLARIINVEGRKQLGRGFGGAKSPDCSGFTAAELQSLDFSKMDLSEFYAEIVPKDIDIGAVKTAIQNRIVTNPSKSYFDRSSP